MNNEHPINPTGLIILDGWGHRTDREHNAIAKAKTPFFDALFATHPASLLHASGGFVGLPEGQIGNSEVGHLSIGSGRVVKQNLQIIDESAQRHFAGNDVIDHALTQLKHSQGNIHVIGLYSCGGVHSHENHINALIECIGERCDQRCYLHLILDGRDASIQQSLVSLRKLDKLIENRSNIQIATVCGRFFAMDRDQRWQRTKRYYDLIVRGDGQIVAYDDLLAEIEHLHAKGVSDEFVEPMWINQNGLIDANDVVFMMNFRVDRMRQITSALLAKKFHHFPTKSAFSLVTLTEYSAEFSCPVMFANRTIKNHLGDYLAHQKLTQLRLAETEKYPHVTYFFNGGEDIQYAGELRKMVDSPKVKTYDLAPQMSARALTNCLIHMLGQQTIDFFVVNFANADMVGHTGVMSACIEAIEEVDRQLKRMIKAVTDLGFQILVSADHGNAELMFDDDLNVPHTAHTLSKVPCIYVGDKNIHLSDGSITQIAPTILELMGLRVPFEMSESLIVKAN